MKKLQQLYALLDSNGVSSPLVDLEQLSFGHLRGVGITTEGQVDILESFEYDSTGNPTQAVIRCYSKDKLVKTIKL